MHRSSVAACPAHAECQHDLYHLVQYIFTVRRADCLTCPPLRFNSTDTRGDFPGLTPDTLVRQLLHVNRRAGTRLGCGPRPHTSAPRSLAAVAAAEGLLTMASCLPPLLQYNVTVVGVDKQGRVTRGTNMLQFRTPKLNVPPPLQPGRHPPPKPAVPPPLKPVAHPPPKPPSDRSLKLISARALGFDRGTATAQPTPSGIFTKASFCGDAHGGAVSAVGEPVANARLEMRVHQPRPNVPTAALPAVHLHAAEPQLLQLPAAGVQQQLGRWPVSRADAGHAGAVLRVCCCSCASLPSVRGVLQAFAPASCNCSTM